MKNEVEGALSKLKSFIRQFKSAVVCFSGGTDSSLVLKVAAEVLGKENVVAFLGISPSIPQREIKDALEIARTVGVRVEKAPTFEMSNPDYRRNDANRCFFCKSELFRVADRIKESFGFDVVFDGSNRDDIGDFRPGMRAAKVFNVRSPLKESEIGKDLVRKLLNHYGLKVANKPSFACLSSRIEYDLSISESLLRKIEKVEDFLQEKGFKNYRARVHRGNFLRIEVEKDEISKFLNEKLREEVVSLALSLGFVFVTLDLEGFVSGKMNRVIKKR